MMYIQPKSTSIITFAKKKHCSSDSFFESVPHAVVCQCHQTLPGQLNAHFLVNTDILYKSSLHHLQGFENTKKIAIHFQNASWLTPIFLSEIKFFTNLVCGYKYINLCTGRYSGLYLAVLGVKG